VGHCGFSLAPVVPGRARLLQEYLAGFAPWIETRETTFAAYMDGFPPTAVNTIMQVGHNTLRLMTVGMDNRAPTDDEIVVMQQLLAEGLAAGAIGLSSGLFTAPGLVRAAGRAARPAGRGQAARRNVRDTPAE
jgi:N-acyl-D-amino-acid deacylase